MRRSNRSCAVSMCTQWSSRLMDAPSRPPIPATLMSCPSRFGSHVSAGHRRQVIARHDTPLPGERVGIAISTYGKVIKRGWDWLGLTPVDGDRITGLVEAPDLAEC